jgi:hypothetical protein
MALVMTPIYTQTVGATSVGNVIFNNVPQFYTDLNLVISARSLGSSGGRIRLNFNNSAANTFSTTVIAGTGSTAVSFREANSNNIIISPFSMSNDTSNVFTNSQVYIPNYTSNNFKSLTSDAVKENNTSTITNYEGMNLTAGLWQNTSAITSLVIVTEGGNFVQHSTFSLYGIIRSGA